MLDNFRFETFVDVHSNIFAEYLSSVIAKLPKENPESISEGAMTALGISKRQEFYNRERRHWRGADAAFT